MLNIKLKYDRLLNEIKSVAPFSPELAIILGSGLGDFASNLNTVKEIRTSELCEYPASTVQGHDGKICFSEFNGKKVLLFKGRIHFYEGYKLEECILPVHLAKELGCQRILLTNAAGGINPNFSPGNLMINTSYNSLFIMNEITELIGIASKEEKDRSLDFPSKAFNELIEKAAKKENIQIREGVYWYTKGPSYETPSEIKMIKKYGGDCVGMSTVHEAVYASVLGMQVAGISCITNYAAGITNSKLSHKEVTETANMVKNTFERLLKSVISLL